jgi:lanosterol synthase
MRAAAKGRAPRIRASKREASRASVRAAMRSPTDRAEAVSGEDTAVSGEGATVRGEGTRSLTDRAISVGRDADTLAACRLPRIRTRRMSSGRTHDVVVIGAGPAGCGAALAHADAGASVLVLEANPRAADRLAGEWLHPTGVEALAELGIDLRSEPRAHGDFDSGRGFVVSPDDGSAPIRLDYEAGSRGWSGDHRMLVDRLRDAVRAHPRARLLEGTRVMGISGQEIAIRCDRGDLERLRADRIVGADGRSSRARASLGLPAGTTTVSRMAGLRLVGAMLPDEGYGHIFLGGPGPILAYRIRADQVRLCLDVPLALPADAATLWDGYAAILPEPLREPFRRALVEGAIAWAANQVRPRTSYGRPGLALVGDAVGFQHPLTAAGIGLGLRDAIELARAPGFEAWARARRRDTRVAERLGGVLYEVFSDDAETTTAIRRGIDALWRSDPRERVRTMRYLAGRPGQLPAFVRTFTRVALPALARLGGRALVRRDMGRAKHVAREIGARARWLVSGHAGGDSARIGSASTNDGVERSSRTGGGDAEAGRLASLAAIGRAVDRLATLQSEPPPRPGAADRAHGGEGGWEGEVVWCPMLAAQLVIFFRTMGLEIAPARRTGLLRQLERTQRPDGLWGMHALSPPYLFVTTLAYVAARLLGVAPDAPLLARAGAFIRREDVRRIPSWGKLWLALAGLFDWQGVPPVLPEVWALPRGLPLHPSHFYCHTRLIYLAMSVLYARKPEPPPSRLRDALRAELFADGFDAVDWAAARRSLRDAELVTPWSLPLRLFYEAAAFYERRPAAGLRRRCLAELDERIRWELRTTDHTSISPVSGMLNVLALASGDPDDPEIKRAIEQLEMWIWEDAEDGTRVAGARSASWDTAFALQALAAARPHGDVREAVARGAAFLRGEQIRSDAEGFADHFRLDPDGGWCFANAWHGWPVSDCTAEALDALLAAEPGSMGLEPCQRAVAFMLRTQNRDGGFGSYEARRSRWGLEWLNPAEMFGDSMSEASYVECTGSCIAALAHAMRHHPTLDPERTRRALARAVRRLRAMQRADGAWRGVWAVHLGYGTLFGIRGLVAAGAPASDPAIRRARRWLAARQRADGGWGESHLGCVPGEYVEAETSSVVQTAWALLGLLEAHEPDWRRIERGARFLVERQRSDGSWPREAPTGLFFRSALLDYALYRQIFPLWALSAVETRRAERLA